MPRALPARPGKAETDLLTVSSSLRSVTPPALKQAGVKAKPTRERLIEDFADGWRDWYQLNQGNPHHWFHATRKIIDPTWMGPKGGKLVVDLETDAEDNHLAVGIEANMWQGYTGRKRDTFHAIVPLPKAGAQSISLSPVDFKNEAGKAMADWDEATELQFIPAKRLRGKRATKSEWNGKPLVLKQLRWEGGDMTPRLYPHQSRGTLGKVAGFESEFKAAIDDSVKLEEKDEEEAEGKGKRPPNFIIVFLDDSGWADFHPFGKPPYPTPHVAQLAKDGCRFNNFYVPQAICSASRASILTGSFPGRHKMFGAHAPKAPGLNPDYKTLAEILKPAGYATGCFGKWHLGDQKGRWPLDRGFDENVGIMYSNDMWRNHPGNPDFWGKWPLVFWDNGKAKVEDSDHEHQKEFTKWITEAAVDFIKRHKDEPFFCYVPHPQPHVPLYVSKKFEGISGAGLYGDVMVELDWSVGQLVKALKDNGIEDNTVFMMTSDNGPWISYGDHAGATPFREAKGTSFDGGCRSACIVKSPGEIKAGSSSTRTWCSVDVVPTFAKLAGAKIPGEIDGHDVWPLLTGDKAFKNPSPFYEQTIGGDAV